MVLNSYATDSCIFLSQGAAGAAVQYLGYTPGLFIVGLFAILILWMYANFWITGALFIVGGTSWFPFLTVILYVLQRHCISFPLAFLYFFSFLTWFISAVCHFFFCVFSS